jgi:hypothetical protein
MLQLFNEESDWQSAELPSYNNIGNWFQKAGYHVYEEAHLENYPEGYSIITDESMMTGSEKLLLTMDISAYNSEDKSWTAGDVRILDMEVKTSWNSASIKDEFDEVTN